MNASTELNTALSAFFQQYPWVIALLLWETVWKGSALYKAAGHKQPIWFVVLFLINTAGILPIVYILFFQKNNHEKKVVS